MSTLSSTLQTHLREVVTRHGIESQFERLVDLARITFLMRVIPVDPTSLLLGASHLGGTPDLPTNVDWPTNPADGKLLEFIGQINLADLPDEGQMLPRVGLLQMFSMQDEADGGQHHIRIINNLSDLSRAEIPKAEMYSDEDADEPFGTLAIEQFTPSVSLPGFHEVFGDTADELYDGYSDLLSNLHSDPAQQEPTSRLLGYPTCEFESTLPNKEWELLAQIESHFAGDCVMNFWDAGAIQFIVSQSEIRNSQFQGSLAFISSM